ncbi:AAA family ATPase [Candidatus Electrothrix sp.]|uniref:AAA family ATPase n=1 Tax=Candidatus Electrothrix sp. TaxID=2170559 RepID=UPI00405778A5
MYLQHFGLESFPFTRQPNPDVFFTQAGRKNILQALRHDLQQGHAAMLLTGPQGAGKTIFCQLIRHRLKGSSCKVVFLNNPVGSFEALLKQICEQLGMTSTTDTGQDITATLQTLQTLLQKQKDQGRRVLLLIDEAEKMFLAALERLFRLLNETNTTYGMQILLAGQTALNASIEQLSSYCEDVRITSIYELESFSKEETAAYLTYRLRAAKSIKEKKGGKGASAPVFSEDAVEKITRLGKGIPGLMDEIAETSLKKAASNKADTVQQRHVSLPEKPQTPSAPLDDNKAGKRRTGLLFLLLLLLLILFFFARPSFFTTQKETPQSPLQPSTTLSPENKEIAIGTAQEEDTAFPFAIIEEPGTVDPLTEPPPSSSSEEEKPSLLPLPVPQRPDFKQQEEEDDRTREDNKITVKEQEAGLPRQDTSNRSEETENKDQEQTLQQAPDATEQEEEETVPVLSPEELKETVQTDSTSEGDTESLTTAKRLPVIQPASIIELKPGMRKTKPPAPENSSPETKNNTNAAPPKQKTLMPVASAQGISPTAREAEAAQLPKITITPISSPSRAITADQLFARYLEAGNRWNKEKYGDKFTVQLLVLSSNDAVEKIKKMIIRDEYQEHTRKLHILRRETLPPTLFVCYGVYKSINEARNARNAMPLFLRKHHPYALSISDVLAKARDEESLLTEQQKTGSP